MFAALLPDRFRNAFVLLTVKGARAFPPSPAKPLPVAEQKLEAILTKVAAVEANIAALATATSDADFVTKLNAALEGYSKLTDTQRNFMSDASVSALTEAKARQFTRSSVF